MAKAPYGRSKPAPLKAPIADEAKAMPASDRDVRSDDNVPKLSRDAVATFADELGQRDGILQRIDDVVAAADRAKADTEEQSGRCADLQRQISAVLGVVESARKGVKEPYLEAGRAVDEAANKHKHRLNTALEKVRKLLTEFARREMARRQREEAERRAAEEEQRKADEAARAAAEEKGEPAPEPVYDPEPPRPAPPERVAVRGDYGAVASTQKVWKGEVVDWRKAFRAVEGNQAVRKAVEIAVAARIRAGDREIPGVRIYEDVAVRVR